MRSRFPGSRSALENAIQIEHLPVTALISRRNNPRTHSDRQIRQIAASIETFGFTNPILIDSQGVIIAGHGRVRAAKLLGLQSVPTVQLDHLSQPQVRAYVIADNRLAELAGWDRDLLAIELQGLTEIDLDFDLEVVGFDTPELDLLITGKDPEAEVDPADVGSGLTSDGPVVSAPGDLWLIGPHRLLCADALDADSYVRLLDGHRADLVFVDPPFNVRVNGHVSGNGRMRHPEFAMASGEMSEAEFTGFLEKALGHHAAHSRDGAIHFVAMDWRHSGELLAASRSAGLALKNLCVWVKSNAGMGSFYRSQHELIYVFKVGIAPHLNNVELGRHGRHRSNVWRYAGVNSFGEGRAEALADHPTIKPIRMVADAILDCSKWGDRVLDGFAGSGTTLLAAERTGRVGYGIEIAPRYVDVAIRRLAEHAGLAAVLASSGRSFNEVADERANGGQGSSSSDSQSDSPSEV